MQPRKALYDSGTWGPDVQRTGLGLHCSVTGRFQDGGIPRPSVPNACQPS